jgi:hypothetical protein
LVPLAHNDTSAGERKGDGTGKAGQSCTDDGDRGADSALKRAHTCPHRSNT